MGGLDGCVSFARVMRESRADCVREILVSPQKRVKPVVLLAFPTKKLLASVVLVGCHTVNQVDMVCQV